LILPKFTFGLKYIPFLFASVGLMLAACTTPSPTTNNPPSTPSEPQGSPVSGRLVVYSGRSEPLIQPVLAAFQAHHADVEVLLKSGSNSALANALLEERNNPQADLFITTEMTTIQALNRQGIFQSYRSPAASSIPPEYIGPEDGWIGLTRRARVIMYNSELVSADEAPESIFELSDPKWRGQIATAGSTNGSMQAQIAALRQLIGEEATEAWLRDMVANDVTFFGGHTDVRKAVGAGEFNLGLVNHYYYYLQKEEGSPVGIVFPDQGEGQIGLITNATSVAIVAGASNPVAAQALVDFLLSPEGQKIFAELNFEYPLVSGVPLHPEVEPLENYRLADVDIAATALNLDETFDLIEKVGLP
jgi:iron(III) transport system substrate-binding protein